MEIWGSCELVAKLTSPGDDDEHDDEQTAAQSNWPPQRTLRPTLLFPVYFSVPKVKMRWLPAFVSALCATGTLAQKKSTEKRFTEFHTKSLSGAPIKLDDAGYRSLTSTPRDYTAAIVLTALDPRYACQLCREFQPEWDLLSKSWVKGDKKGESRLILASLDFDVGKDIFMSVCAASPWMVYHACANASSSLVCKQPQSCSSSLPPSAPTPPPRPTRSDMTL